MTYRNWRLAALSTALIGGFAGASAALEIKVLSSTPELVSGKEALVELTGVTEPPVVTINGRASNTAALGLSGVKTQFKPLSTDPTKQIGLITNLQLGPNKVEITSGGAKNAATVTLVAHDINNTLFAGPQDTPFLCEIEAFGLERANSTDVQFDPLKAKCPAVPKITYHYRTGGKWQPFNPAMRPADIDKGANGQALIIRQEIGVINRAAYVISIPHDPAAGPLPTPTDRGASGWTGKLLYSFGPGARGDGHHMGRGLGNLAAATQWVGDANGSLQWYIEHGYAVASSSLNSFGTTTDAVVSAESAYKVKEQFIKEFGPPVFTVSNGASGGSMQQQMIGNAYPGLIDGLVPSISYSDGMTFFQPIYDCELLVNVFKTGTWTKAQMDAVSGKYWGFCVSNSSRYPTARAQNCDAAVLEMPKKFPAVKLEDIRCTFQDDLIQVFGDDPKTGLAHSPFDNVGVQYGLKALNDGVITMDQFIDINKRIGGLDVDGKIVAARMVGNADALKAAYATGQVNQYNGGNKSIPIVSTRYNLDGDPFNRGDANVDVHDRYHSAISQARMEKYNGNSNNYVQLLSATVGPGYGPSPSTVGSPFNLLATEAVEKLDAWMTAIANDKSNKSQAEKVVANKPKDFVNACWTVDGKNFADWTAANAVKGKVEKITDWAKCNELFPMYADPRLVAGAPATNDVFKCALKPVSAADYKTAPTAAQLDALKAAFPEGVCDYTKPGVGMDQKLVSWASFTDYGKWTSVAPK